MRQAGAGLLQPFRRTVEAEEIEFLRGVLDRYMPGASGPVTYQVTCMYTMTPDEQYIIEPHPDHAGVGNDTAKGAGGACCTAHPLPSTVSQPGTRYAG